MLAKYKCRLCEFSITCHGNKLFEQEWRHCKAFHPEVYEARRVAEAEQAEARNKARETTVLRRVA